MRTNSLETLDRAMRGRRTSQLERFVFLVLLCLTLFLTPASLFADSVYIVNVNTSSLAGNSAQLAFDFIDGGPPSNTITLSNFSTNGTLGSNSPSGGVSGSLPGTVTLTDTSFFNEYLTNITLGTSFSFLLDATTNGPDASSIPDAFSLFLLDPVTGLPLFTTIDPTGSNSLLTLNIDGSSNGALGVFTLPGDGAVVTATPFSTSTVPEPGTFFLLVSGLAFLSYKRRALAKR
jgi:hypothetical protein